MNLKNDSQDNAQFVALPGLKDKEGKQVYIDVRLAQLFIQKNGPIPTGKEN